MRILIINCVSDRSEIELYKGLKARGVDIELVCDPRETRQDELRALGIPTEALKISNRLDLFAIYKLRRKLNSLKYDLVYAPTSRGLAVALLAYRGKDLKFVTYRGTMGNLSYFDPGSRLAHLNSRVTGIICVCKAVKRDLLRVGLPEQKIFSVYKGHRTQWYQAASVVDLQLEFGISEKAFVLACVANLRPLKGVDVLLKAIHEVQSEQPIHCLLIGELRDKRLPILAKKLGIAERVHFTGFRSDALAVVRSCNLSVLVSTRREGLARSVIESMIQGVPAIVSDTGGLPEIVTDGEDGAVVPSEDYLSLAAAIQNLVGNSELLNSYSVKARENMSRRFSAETYIDNMLSVFQNLTEN